MKPKSKKAATAVATCDDLLPDLSLLADDPAPDAVQLSTAPITDGAPPSPRAQIIAANLVAIESNRQRAKHEFRELPSKALWDQIRIRFSAKRGSAGSITALAGASQRGGGPGLAATILEHGCSLNRAVALIRVAITAIGLFEAELRGGQRRRRHLCQDLKLMRDDRRPASPGAGVKG